MKVDVLDAHDRYAQFTKKSFDIGECCQDLSNRRPFGNYPFYAFVHTRTEDDGVTKRVIWQPRLTKPKAQTNSMLFKLYPGTDLVKVIWMIPPREMWAEYEKGKVAESEAVWTSIQSFQYARAKLEANENDDLDDETIDRIYRELSQEANFKRMSRQQNEASSPAASASPAENPPSPL